MSFSLLRRPAQLGVLALLAARLALGAAYSAIVPIWEADNENGHFAYAYYLARHQRLLQAGDPEAEAIFQKFQPPLYYALAAGVLAFFDLGPNLPQPERNPYIQDGSAGSNYALHPAVLSAAEAELWRAVLAVRLFGVVLSTLSVVPVFLAMRSVWPGRPGGAWMATAVYAFWPQFLFTGSMVTNDVLVTALGAVIFYLAIRLTQDGFRLRLGLGLGLALGAAALAKINALGLLPMAAVALAASVGAGPVRRHRLGLAALALAVVLGLAVGTLSSLPYVTQQVFQVSTLERFVRLAPGLEGAPANSLGLLFETPEFIFRTLLASYGWGNLETDGWVYVLWELAALAAGLGLVLWAARRPGWAAARPVIVAATGLAGLAGLALGLSIASQTMHVPGRYLLPALPCLALLSAAGWQALLPARLQPAAARALAAGMSCLGLYIAAGTLAHEYARPPAVDPAAAAGVDRSVQADFGDAIRLWGYIPAAAAQPGGQAALSLCWKAQAPVNVNYSLVLEAVGPDGQGYSRYVTYPGRGNYPTRFWLVGQAFCDRVEVPVGSAFPAPALGGVSIRLEDAGTGQALPARGADGQDLGVRAIVPLVVRGSSPPGAPAQATEYRFGNELVLLGYTVTALPKEAGLRVGLLWRAAGAARPDLNVYVHLRDTPQSAYVQSDGAPRNGRYPTWAWAPGEAVLDEHDLTWPAVGPRPALKLFVGVYRPADLQRLPVTDAEGRAQANDEIELPLP